jgi:hypothetical protein
VLNVHQRQRPSKPDISMLDYSKVKYPWEKKVILKLCVFIGTHMKLNVDEKV